MHCNNDCSQRREEKREEKIKRREEKREAKHRRREEKREAKHRRHEEKREAKQKYCEVKRYLRNEFRNHFMQPPTSHNNVIAGNSNVHYNNFHNERIEHDIAAIRTIFPDCDPEYIRNCLANETVDHKRKVAEKLLATDYPKVAPVSPATIPTAPPLPSRSSCDLPNEEAPPSYEESVGPSPFLQPPQLPKRHNRSSSWNGTSIAQSRSIQPTQPTQPIQQTQSNSQRSYEYYSSAEDVADAIGTAVKNFFAGFKPSSVQHACHKSSHVLMRPVPSRCELQQLPTDYKVTPKDKYSIQRGFGSSSYPTKKLRRNDVSEEDWYFFINGLNSIIGANSFQGSQNKMDGFSVSLKWVSWMKVTMDEKLMDSNIDAINEYLNKWNINFFNPRKMMIEFIDDRTPTTPTNDWPGFSYHNLKQYLLIKSI